MDNPTNIEAPVGAEGATSSQDNATTVETQPLETAEVVSANEPAEEGQAPQYPWQSEEKFKDKTPEDIYKSYQEMEKNYSRKAEVVNLIEEKFGVTPEQLRATIEAQEQAERQARYQNDPAGYALQEVEELKAQLAYQNEEKQLDGFLKENPEYAPHRDEILELGLNLYNGRVREELSYEDIANKFFGAARAQGQQDAYKKIETKKQTQATATRTAPQGKKGYEALQDLPRAERIKAFETMSGL